MLIELIINGAPPIPVEMVPFVTGRGPGWLSGVGAPGAGLGLPGTQYLQDNGAVWYKSDAGWVLTAVNLKAEVMGERRHAWVEASKTSYSGVAPIGSGDGEAVWKITRIVVADNGDTTKTVADMAVWTERHLATYS